MTLASLLVEARRTGDFAGIVAAVPYAQYMGFEVRLEEGDVFGVMRYGGHLVGNPTVGALHGGTLGALMEFTAIFKLLHASDVSRVPKTVNITVEYLRSARCVDTFARAHLVRLGRRIANLRIVAYQDDPARPVSAASAHFLLDRSAR